MSVSLYHTFFCPSNLGRRQVFLSENHIQPKNDLLYADNRQALVETIYTPANIFDNVLEAQMEHASLRDTTVETIMSLLRKKKIVML